MDEIGEFTILPIIPQTERGDDAPLEELALQERALRLDDRPRPVRAEGQLAQVDLITVKHARDGITPVHDV